MPAVLTGFRGNPTNSGQAGATTLTFVLSGTPAPAESRVVVLVHWTDPGSAGVPVASGGGLDWTLDAMSEHSGNCLGIFSAHAPSGVPALSPIPTITWPGSATKRGGVLGWITGLEPEDHVEDSAEGNLSNIWNVQLTSDLPNSLFIGASWVEANHGGSGWSGSQVWNSVLTGNPVWASMYSMYENIPPAGTDLIQGIWFGSNIPYRSTVGVAYRVVPPPPTYGGSVDLSYAVPTLGVASAVPTAGVTAVAQGSVELDIIPN